MMFLITIVAVSVGFGTVISSPYSKEDDALVNPVLKQEESVYESFLREHEDVHAISVQMSQALCNDFYTFDRAAREAERRLRAIDINEGSVCYLIKNKFKHVLEPLTIAIDTCGEGNSDRKFVLTIIRALGSLARYLCQSKGEEILDVIHPCMAETALRLYADNETMSKIEKLSDDIELSYYLAFSVSGVEAACEVAKEIRNFYERHMDCCLPSTKRYIVGLMDAITDPCNGL